MKRELNPIIVSVVTKKRNEQIVENALLPGRKKKALYFSEELDYAKDVLSCFLKTLFEDSKSKYYWAKSFPDDEKQTVFHSQIVSARVKDTDSIVEKIENKLMKLKSKTKKKIDTEKESAKIYDSLTDLVGARIVFTTSAEAKKAGDFINLHFHVDEYNSGDKAEMKDTTEFGYLSIHYIVPLKGDFFENVEHRAILRSRYDESSLNALKAVFEKKPLRVEIQIRSLLQHAWAELVHDTVYKNKAYHPETGDIFIPPESKRTLNAIAAVLENADNTLNNFMYLYHAQKEQSANKYQIISEYLAGVCKLDLHDEQSKKYSLKSLLFEVEKYLEFHPEDVWALSAKVLAKSILLWGPDSDGIDEYLKKDPKKRTSKQKREIYVFKNRVDDILNTLMHIIKINNESRGKHLDALKMIARFNPDELKNKNPKNDKTEWKLLVKTVKLATKLAINAHKPVDSCDKRYVMWLSNTQDPNAVKIRCRLNRIVQNLEFDGTSIAMVYPTDKQSYDDSDQLARVLPRKKILFSNAIHYNGKTDDDWAKNDSNNRFYATKNERYSLYEFLHVLTCANVNPPDLKVIGCNLQRAESMFCRFALAVGIEVLICEHSDMTRFRASLRGSEWTGMKTVPLNRKEIQKFLNK